MPAQPSPIGSWMEPPAIARTVYTGGPPDSREDKIAVPWRPAHDPSVDNPLGHYLRDEILPDGSWRMAWHGLGLSDR